MEHAEDVIRRPKRVGARRLGHPEQELGALHRVLRTDCESDLHRAPLTPPDYFL